MNNPMRLAELQHRLDLLVCQDDEVLECCGCENGDECQKLAKEIKQLEKI